ncbi:MAG: hypothetical protein WBF50_19630 [Pseudolabrys sp.]
MPNPIWPVVLKEVYHIREPQKLPAVMGVDEIKRLLAVASSLKTRVLLSLGYGWLFTVDGARAWSNALKVNAGSRVALNRYASLFASFDGEFSNSGNS